MFVESQLVQLLYFLIDLFLPRLRFIFVAETIKLITYNTLATILINLPNEETQSRSVFYEINCFVYANYFLDNDSKRAIRSR